MSSAKAVQTEAVKTIIADFINPFAFKYRASKKMSQNSERLSWTFEEVDGKLKGIMETIYANISDAAKRYNATVGGKTDYVAGANIAGFEKVVDAMLAQGVC